MSSRIFQKKKTETLVHMREIYAQLPNLESAVQYMKSQDFEKGGWFVLAHQAAAIKKMQEDISSIKNILTNKPPISLVETTSIKTTQEAIEPWITLKDACFELSSEGYDVVFNPSLIKQYVDRHMEYFVESTLPNSSDQQKELGKYSVKKEKLLQDLTQFPYQTSSQRRLFANFIEWRKRKHHSK